jgi:polyhydroxyalkanoate synthesis regulator phasin
VSELDDKLMKGTLSTEETVELTKQHIQRWKQEIADAESECTDRLRNMDEYVKQRRRDIVDEYYYKTEPLRKQIEVAVNLIVDHEMLKGPKPIFIRDLSDEVRQE